MFSATVILALLGIVSCSRSSENRPNFLFIVIDCWRYDQLNDQISPNIYSLAQQGVSFRKYYVNAGYTRPSMGAIFSSQYPAFEAGEDINITGFRRFGGTNMNRRNLETFSANLQTFPELLKNNGYETIAVTQMVNTGVAGGYGPKQWDQLLEIPFSTTQGLDIAGDSVTNEAIKQLAIRKKTKPFLLYAHYIDAHYPYDRIHLTKEEVAKQKEYYGTAKNENTELREKLLPEVFRRYQMGIRYIDSQVARLIESVNRDDTVIIITGDHGEMFNEKGYIAHSGQLPEEIVHVPLVIAGPGIEAAANDHMIQSVDLMPTILSLAGVDIPADIQGQALLSQEYVTKPVVAFSPLETALISKKEIIRTPLIKHHKSDEDIRRELKTLGYLE